MFVKFCGFTRSQDIECAAMLPVSSVGFIFHEKSDRFITAEKGAEFSGILKGTGILKTGVFVKSSVDEIKRTAEIARLDMLQVYDKSTARELKGFLPIIEAFRVKGANELPDKSSAEFILLDAFSDNEYGGTGKSFHHEILNNYPLINRTIIAGGVNSSNLKKIIIEAQPFGVDISSGIETARGIKSSHKMREIFSIIMEAENGTDA
jgi:phosphoribosylanthranilate isomerase